MESPARNTTSPPRPTGGWHLLIRRGRLGGVLGVAAALARLLLLALDVGSATRAGRQCVGWPGRAADTPPEGIEEVTILRELRRGLKFCTPLEGRLLVQEHALPSAIGAPTTTRPSCPHPLPQHGAEGLGAPSLSSAFPEPQPSTRVLAGNGRGEGRGRRGGPLKPGIPTWWPGPANSLTRTRPPPGRRGPDRQTASRATTHVALTSLSHPRF